MQQLYNFADNECYFRIKWSGEAELIKLPCYPEEVSEQVSPNWSPQNPIGRVGSVFAYTGTSDVSYSFSFDLHAELCNYTKVSNTIGDLVSLVRQNSDHLTNKHGKEEKDLDFIIKKIKSACYPEIGAGGGLAPPKVQFKFGYLYMTGRLDSVNITWKLPIINKQYAVCTVSVSLTSAHSKILSKSDIQSASSRAGYKDNIK